jgi:hypothetical protein
MPQRPTAGHDAGEVVGTATRAELKRVAVLFLLSSITLLLVLVYAVVRALFVRALEVTVVPDIVWVMWVVSMLCGFVATWGYGVYVTARARRWFWVALCVLPLTAVPCSVAYAWIRRGELEVEIVAQRGRGAQ